MISKLIRRLKDSNTRGDMWILIRYLNLFKTIYINFRKLPLRQAVHLPIIIFGRVSFLSLNGKITIESNKVSTGMIMLGFPLDIYFNPSARGLIKLQGEFVFRGPAVICCGYNFNIAPQGTLTIGKNIRMGAMNNFNCISNIIIGDYSRIAFETVFMSSSFHFVLDQTTNKVANVVGNIIIGEYNWIGNRSVIYKGVRTPNNLIVASGSMLNKDYTKSVKEYSMIGGAPAKLLKENVSRVWNGKSEAKLQQMFRQTCESCLDATDIHLK